MRGGAASRGARRRDRAMRCRRRQRDVRVESVKPAAGHRAIRGSPARLTAWRRRPEPCGWPWRAGAARCAIAGSTCSTPGVDATCTAGAVLGRRRRPRCAPAARGSADGRRAHRRPPCRRAAGGRRRAAMQPRRGGPRSRPACHRCLRARRRCSLGTSPPSVDATATFGPDRRVNGRWRRLTACARGASTSRATSAPRRGARGAAEARGHGREPRRRRAGSRRPRRAGARA